MLDTIRDSHAPLSAASHRRPERISNSRIATIETAHSSYANAGKVGTSIASDAVYMLAAETEYPRGKARKLLQAAHKELFDAGPRDCRRGLAPRFLKRSQERPRGNRRLRSAAAGSD